MPVLRTDHKQTLQFLNARLLSDSKANSEYETQEIFVQGAKDKHTHRLTRKDAMSSARTIKPPP